MAPKQLLSVWQVRANDFDLIHYYYYYYQHYYLYHEYFIALFTYMICSLLFD